MRLDASKHRGINTEMNNAVIVIFVMFCFFGSFSEGITEDRLAAYGLTSFPQKRQQYQIRQKNNKQKCKNHQEIAFKSSSLDSETKQ